MFSLTGKSLLLLWTVSISASVSSNKPTIHDFSKLGRNNNICQRKAILSRKQMHWYPYSGNYQQILSLVQTESLWSLRWKACFENKSRVYWPKVENKAAVFTHLQQNSEQNIYCSVLIFSVPGGHTLHKYTCCHSQAYLVTEMAQCLKPRQIWYFLEVRLLVFACFLRGRPVR